MIKTKEETKKVVSNGREAFKIWAPCDCRWTDWVRPVPFVIYNPEEVNQIMNFTIPEVFFLDSLRNDTAIFLNLPGYEAIKEGLALARLGWRPIPLYNGTDEQPEVKALIDNHCTECALFWGASLLKDLNIKKDAPPAFLLDYNRTHRYKPENSYFDNSWDLYSQDIPSAEYFLANGINKIVVCGEKIQKDLKRIFYPFQKKGITILLTNGYDEPVQVTVRKQKPSSI